MQLVKNKVEEFSKTHPDCRNFLQSVVRKAEEETNVGILVSDSQQGQADSLAVMTRRTFVLDLLVYQLYLCFV